jgi:hypothetical protein
MDGREISEAAARGVVAVTTSPCPLRRPPNVFPHPGRDLRSWLTTRTWSVVRATSAATSAVRSVEASSTTTI